MKKLTLIILVAMVPFLSIAQKRSKKDKAKVINTSYEFMIITGKTKATQQLSPSGSGTTPIARAQKMNISFDFGGLVPPAHLQETQYKSMAHAVNIAARDGWEFVSANIVKSGPMILHHYYMKRKK